mmetsp:Transcript_6222/g.16060  ORF Transcript_6222/g.16060 Transcript_6222/m.16060 type:complete len:299 (-) Transcript_6222:182-1078(-)
MEALPTALLRSTSLPAAYTMISPQEDTCWSSIRDLVAAECQREPLMQPKLHAAVLSQRTLEGSLAHILAHLLAGLGISSAQWAPILNEAFERGTTPEGDPLGDYIRKDLRAVSERDPACPDMAHCLLFFKGFHGLQAHRVSHWLWGQNRTSLAFLIQSRVSQVFGMDIHPAARIGHSIMFDHATGIVIGETAVVSNGCSLLHGVTLGGTGKEHGDRHPKLEENVIVGAGATILGNISIGKGAKIAACSVVVKAVPPGVTVAGCPARVVGLGKKERMLAHASSDGRQADAVAVQARSKL